MKGVRLKEDNFVLTGNKCIAGSPGSVSFNGLNRQLSKRLIETSDSFGNLNRCCEKSKGIIGNLPSEWVLKMPKDGRGDRIKQFYSDFGAVFINFLKQSNNKYNDIEQMFEGAFSSNSSDELKDFSREVTSIFKRAKIIGEEHSIKIEAFPDNSGSFGEVFRVSGPFNSCYALKKYKKVVLNCQQELMLSNNFLYTNTSAGEAGRAAFIQKHLGKNAQMVPFFFADVNSDYMLNKFIDDSVPKPKRDIPLEIFGLGNPDCARLLDDGKNKIRGYQIDYGCINLQNRVISQDKELQKLYSKIISKDGNGNKLAINQLISSSDNKTKEKLIRSLNPFILDKCPSMISSIVNQSDKEVCKVLSKRLFEIKSVGYYSKFSFECFKKQAKRFFSGNFSRN